MSLDRTDIEDIYPLSPTQRGMLFHLLYQEGSRAYFNQLAFTLDGALDRAAFVRALEYVIARHPVLRSSLHWEDLERPLQVVARKVAPPLHEEDLRGRPVDAQQERLAAFLGEDRARGFALATAPLFRVAVLRLGDASYRIVFSFLHVLLEGMSAVQLLGEIFTSHEAFRAGEEPQLPKRRPYRDYIAWLQAQDPKRADGFWRDALAGFPAPTPLQPAHVADKVGAPVTRFAEAETELSEPDFAWIRGLAQRQRLTLNTLIQGAWAVLLARYAQTEDVVFGATVSGRSAPLEGIEQMVGLFVNTLPVRVKVPHDQTISSWLDELQRQQVEARQYEHSPLPTVRALSEVPPGLPLFESNLVFENLQAEGIDVPRAAVVRPRDVKQTDEGHYPISLIVSPTKTLHLLSAYDADRFSAADVARRLRHIVAILRAFAADPNAPLGSVSLLDDAERRQVLATWNATAEEVPTGALVHELVEAQVDRTPDAVAVIHDGASLTYAELDARANQLARFLRKRGVRPDTRVGVCMHPGLETIVALYGVLKAGGAYVPVDPGAPPERLAHIFADAAVAILLTQDRILDDLPAGSMRAIALDTGWAEIAKEDRARPEKAATRPENLAYVVYTSGSTGEPKGVMVEHRSVVNHNVVVGRRFALRAGDRLLQFTPLNFDAAVEEIFPPLAYGATMVVRGELVPTHEFRAMIERDRLTVLSLPPAYMHEWVRELDQRGERIPSSVRLVLLGGEKIAPESYVLWRKVGGADIPWLNVYGPTEATVTSAMYRIEGEGALELPILPIGMPIGNGRIYLLDGDGAPVPVGHAGELFIAGAGLARGYVRRPAETAEKFLPDPFGPPGSRMYRTQDLARHRDDGQMEFLGRSDDQIKLRGFRIELGEVESVLARHPNVDAAVAVIRTVGDDPEDRRLVAYVVGKTEPAELKRFVGGLLPDYMVPSAFVVLEHLPLTANGKVDKKALPEPDWERPVGQVEYVAPRTATEELVAGIWAEILGVARVGVNDEFFELGGHSFIAMQLVSRVNVLFKADVPLRTIFDAPILGDFVRKIQIGGAVAEAPIVPVPRDAPLPVSSSQDRLWFVHQLAPTDSSYHVPMCFRLRGPIEPASLQAALQAVVRRHEILRTTYSNTGSHAVQIITPAEDVTVSLPVESLEALAPDARDAAMMKIAADSTAAPIDLTKDPMVRARLLKLGPDDHALILVIHHIAVDGWGETVFLHDIVVAYDAHKAGKPSPLEPLALQYADYAAWQRSWFDDERRAGLIGYWKDKLAAPSPLELPTDFPRPKNSNLEGAPYLGAVPVELGDRLRAFSRGEGATLFMTMLAAWKLLLARYSGQDDVIVVTDAANRDRAATTDMLGFFVNQLVLRTDVGGDPTFRELVGRVRETALGAYGHQDLDFEEVVRVVNPERVAGDHSPLFRAKMVVLPNLPGTVPRLPGLEIERFQFATGKAQNDLYLIVDDGGSTLDATLHYRTDLFRRETVDRLWRHYLVLLEGLVREPDEHVGVVSMLPADEARQVLIDWNTTAEEVPTGALVHELFEAQATQTPDAIAVVHDGAELTYAELDARANQLAHTLRGLGVGPDVLVGVAMNPSLETIVALYGVLKAGGAYVPVDPGAPPERLRHIFADAGVVAVLTQRGVIEPAIAGKARVLELDAGWAEIAKAPRTRVEKTGTRPANLAYVVYTSGSTGEPKGVLVEHRSVVNHNVVAGRRFALEPGDRLLQFTPICFDAAVEEIYPPLARGATLVVRGELVPTTEFKGLIDRERLTVLSLPPAYMHEWARELETWGETTPPSVRLVLLGGEKIAPESYALWRNLGGQDIPWLNVYGPTEATVTSAMCLIQGEGALELPILPMGSPIGNARIYLLDGHLQPVPVGHAGEVYIAGAGLARGYLGRAGETGEKFVPDPYGPSGARMYRTKDVARHRPDGRLEFLGRADDQVKLRGFRIELGEVEAALKRHEAVVDAVALVRTVGQGGEGEKRLVAYVVGSAEPATLRKFLEEQLPDYMVPSSITIVDAFPLTANGKIDKKALPEPSLDAGRSGFVAPRNRLELELAQLWQELLEVPAVGVTEDFFTIGGHSLLAVRLMARMKEVLGRTLPLPVLFEQPTIAALAQALAAEQPDTADTPASPLVPIQTKGERAPFFAIHPVGGTVFCYYLLAQKLGKDQPFYGLQALGGFNSAAEPLGSIEAMAAAYLKEMRAVQPQGPYRLGGWSSGGHIALEVAQQLRAIGETVEVLAMFDTISSTLLRDADGTSHEVAMKKLLLEEPDEDKVAAVMAWSDVGGEIEEGIAMLGDVEALWAKGLERAKAMPHFPPNAGERELRRHGLLVARSLRAGLRYEAKPYAGSIAVFATRESLKEFTDPALGWRSLAGGGVTIHPVEGGHLTLMDTPFVETLAERLSPLLGGAERP